MNYLKRIQQENAKRRMYYYAKRLRNAVLEGHTPEALAKIAERITKAWKESKAQ